MRNKAIEVEQRIRAEIKAVLEEETRAEAIAAEREKIEAEKRVQAQRDTLERNRAALAAREQAHTSAEQENKAEQRPRKETNALLAERNRAARLAAAREEMQRAHEAEQRVRAQWEAIERNRAGLEARAQARTPSRDPPIAMANANRATTTSAERGNMEGISEVGRRVEAQREAIERNRALLAARAQARSTSQNPPVTMADLDSTAAISAERENVEWFSEAEQRMRAPRDAVERGRVALEAYEQARTACSNPPTPVVDVNRAVAPLSAHDEAQSTARDSLLSSPVTTSETAPFPQTLDSSADTPMITTTTTSQQQSAVDQKRPGAPRSRAELMQINYRDPEYRELTEQEKWTRRLALMQRATARKRAREKQKRATSLG
ncbi:hypothetical protein MBLNU13_g00465t1 [Cladosporium sp. NU13]